MKSDESLIGREVLTCASESTCSRCRSPHHGHRGIGRYCVNLVSAMLGRDDDHEYVLYVHDELPDTRCPESPRAVVRNDPAAMASGRDHAPYMDRLARTNPDELDVLLVVSPFEKWCALRAARPAARTA